jgi:hypothetical protein
LGCQNDPYERKYCFGPCRTEGGKVMDDFKSLFGIAFGFSFGLGMGVICVILVSKLLWG